VNLLSGHVPTDRLGEAARHGSLDFLRDAERRHVAACERCQRLYGGYRLADRLLAAPWREVKLPPAAAAAPSRRAALAGLFQGVEARTLAPIVAVVAIVALVGAALAMPRLLPVPVAVSQPVASRPTPSPSPPGPAGTPASSGRPAVSPGAQASGPGNAPSTQPGPTPAPTPVPSPSVLSVEVARIGGDPIAWAPDGKHLLVWSGAGRVTVRDSGGRAVASADADAAAWVSGSTFAVATRSFGGHGESISILNLGGHRVATIPGSYSAGTSSWLMLLGSGSGSGSGSGELTIASQGGWGSSGWGFVMWNGSLSTGHRGVPVAFSTDGRRLAVIEPTSVSGSSVTGSLQILAVPSLSSVADLGGLSVRVGTGSLGSAFGFDAAFSPDDRYLLASGTLIDLSRGSLTTTGKGGWLPDGTLATASDEGLLRWRGGHSSLDSRFPGAGTVEPSPHGELIYFYGDGRPALFLDAGGRLNALTFDRVGSISALLISPDGRTVALDGRATDGSSITAVASLP
jgi:hypothetical protein